MDQKKWMKHGEIFPVVQTTLTERKTFGESVTNFFFFFFFFFFQGMKKMFVSVVTAPTYLNPYLMLGETTQAIMLLTTTQTVNFKLESDGTQGEGAF